MIVSFIAAVDEQGGIGKDNRLPWRLSADLQRFKALTMGHHLILGRKTFASIGRPLPGRTTIVLTRNLNFKADGVLIAASLIQALDLAEERGEREVFIIGGAEVFRESLTLADRIYLTRVHASLPADAFFPEMNPEEWLLVESQYHPADEKNEYAFTYQFFERHETPG